MNAPPPREAVVMSSPRLRFAGTVLNAPDVDALASFYEHLLGWPRLMDEADWIALRHPDGGTAIAFQTDAAFTPPVWPGGAGDQRANVHLDFVADDLDAAVEHAVAGGATLAGFQPDERERVLFDPIGHPFCLIPAPPT